MKCKYCGYEDHSFAKVCPICGEAVEEQTVGVRNAGIKTVDTKTVGTEAAETLQQTQEIKESRKAKAEETGNEKSVCPNCGHIDTADTVFCTKCGTRIKEHSYCKYCGTQQDGISQYCSNCGRDKEGKLKPKFANVQEFAEKIPDIKINSEQVKTEGNSRLITVGGASIGLLILLFTNWLHVGAMSALNSFGSYFGYNAGLQTDYSVFGVAQVLWKYGGEFGDESTKIKVYAAALMIAVGASVLCAFTAIAYTFKQKPGVHDALKGLALLVFLLAAVFWIGAIYVSNQLSRELYYPGRAIECTGWLYLSAIAALFLLIKGISLIAPEAIEYAEHQDIAQGDDSFEMQKTAEPETRISEELQNPGQHFFRSDERKEELAAKSVNIDQIKKTGVKTVTNGSIVDEDKSGTECTAPEKNNKKKVKIIILTSLVILLLASGIWFAASKLISTPEESDGNYYVCGLAPAFDGNLYGYVNETGDFEIEPIYENAEPFNANGVAWVQMNGKWGYINKKGEFVVKPQFDCSSEFDTNGIAEIFTDDGSALFDKDGEIPIEQYLLIGNFSECGLASFRNIDEKYGYLNTKGQTIIPAQYDYAEEFAENGLACVQKNKKYGFIDKEGKEIIPCNYEYADSFFKDYPTIVCRDGKYGYINASGEEVIEAKFEDALDFIAGYAAVKCDNKKWGAINLKGELVVSPQFDESFRFSADHYAVANKNDMAYLINAKGDELCRLGHANDVDGRRDAFCTLMLHEWYYNSKEFMENYELFPGGMPAPIGIAGVNDGEWKYGYNLSYGYIDSKGKIVVEPIYEMANPFAENGLAAVETENASGFIDTEGETLLMGQGFFIDQDFVDSSVAVISKDNEGVVEVIDKDGNVLECVVLEFMDETKEKLRTYCNVVSAYKDGYVVIQIVRKTGNYVTDESGDIRAETKVDREIVFKGTEKVFDSDFFESV